MTALRKTFTITEELHTELGEPVQHGTHKAAAAAVIPNPWARAGPFADLTIGVDQIGPHLAQQLTTQLTTALGGVEHIAAFGKATVVGLAGETEHGAALIHTPYFGNIFRELVQGSSVIVFADSSGPAGTSMTVPMWHTTAAGTRSHYQTMPVRISEAPHDDEIVVIAAAATGPRPNARIGDRTTDPAVQLADMEPLP